MNLQPECKRRQAFSAFVLLLLSLVPPLSAQPASQLRVVLRPATVFVGDGEGSQKGFDVDLLDTFVSWYSRRSGEDVTYEARNVKMVPELLAEARERRCDLAVGSITITAERDRTVDFSVPYLPLRSVLFARPGAFPDGEAEKLLVGMRIGAVEGTTHEILGRELMEKVPGLTIDIGFTTQAELFDAVTDPGGSIDAGVTDITHFWIMNQLRDVTLLSSIGPAQGLGFVMPEGSELKPSVDEFLSEFRSTTTYFNLIERYFGKEAAKMIRSAKGSLD